MEMYRTAPQHDHNQQRPTNRQHDNPSNTQRLNDKSKNDHNHEGPEKHTLTDKQRQDPRAHPRDKRAFKRALGLCHHQRDQGTAHSSTRDGRSTSKKCSIQGRDSQESPSCRRSSDCNSPQSTSLTRDTVTNTCNKCAPSSRSTLASAKRRTRTY